MTVTPSGGGGGASSGDPIAATLLLRGVSLATDQQPSAVGTVLQIEFGAAQGSASDPVSLAANGAVTFNDAGSYLLESNFNFGRVGSSGTSHLYARLLIDGVPLGETLHASISTPDQISPFQLVGRLENVAAGAVFTFEIIRDSSGSNFGGLFQSTPLAVGWVATPSVVLSVRRLEIK